MTQLNKNDAMFELKELLTNFTTRVLVEQPVDLVSFGLRYFQDLRRKELQAEQREERLSIQRRLGLRNGRRQSVCSEIYDPSTEEIVNDIEFYEKTPEQIAKIKGDIQEIFLFNSLDEAQIDNVIKAMKPRVVHKGEVIIRQGDAGDYFYVIGNGHFQVRILDDEGAKEVHIYENSGSFGELALMYNEPRAATIEALTDGFLWAVSRNTFKRLVLRSAFEKRERYETLLFRVPPLAPLSDYNLSVICDALIPVTYSDGDVIFKEGDESHGMYFIESGEVRVVQKADDSAEEVELFILSPGSYFGEISLLTKTTRAATCIAIGDLKLAFLKSVDFERLLGPSMHLLRKAMKNYKRK